MPFTEHLVELRKRLIYVFFFLIVISLIIFFRIDFITQRIVTYDNVRLIYTAPSDIMVAHISIALFMGFILILPMIIFQTWKFIKPAINETYHNRIVGVLIFAIVLFYVGLVFSHYMVLPLAMKFLTDYSNLKQVEPVYQIDKYYGFVFSSLIMFGIIFEMPLVITALGYLRLVSVKMLSSTRKYAVLVIFVVATVLSPPDVLSQFLMAVPMILLFELSLVILKQIEKRRVDE